MITMNIDTLSFEISNDGTAWDYLARSPINVLMISGNNKLNTRVVFEQASHGAYIAHLEVNMPSLMNPDWHMLTWHAIQSVVGTHGYLEFLVNQHCAYRYIPSEGNAGMLDSETFKEPSTKGFGATLTGTEEPSVDNPEFIASLYKGGEVKLDVVDSADDNAEQRSPRSQLIKSQMDKMAAKLDTLEMISRHLVEVYPTSHSDDLGIAFEYNGLHYLVNVVDGEEDLAAVMKYRERTMVGIFLHDNVFVTKGHIRKSTMIDASNLCAYDFNSLLVNYAKLYSLGVPVQGRRRVSRRGGRDRSERGSRERSFVRD